MKSDSDSDSGNSSAESEESYPCKILIARRRLAPKEHSFASSFPTIEEGPAKKKSNSQSESILAECSSVFEGLNIKDDQSEKKILNTEERKNRYFQEESKEVPSTSAGVTSEEIPLHEEQERIYTDEESSLQLLDCSMPNQTKLSLEPNLLSSLVLKNKKTVTHHETEVPSADAVKRKLKRSLSDSSIKEQAENSEIMESTASCSNSFKEGRKRKWCDVLDSFTRDASNPLNAVASTSNDFSCLANVEETSFIEEKQVSLNMPSDPVLEPGNNDSPQPVNISKRVRFAKRAPLSFRSSKKRVYPPVSSEVKNAPYVSRSETEETQGEKDR